MASRTSLYDEHIRLNAKMVEFAGWDMPVSYCSILDEHKCVRENVGLFDVSHMGEVFVSGKDSLEYLNSLVPQDITKLVDTKAVYCQLLNDKAGLVDDLIIYKFKDNDYMIILNASRIEADYNWLVDHIKNYEVKVENKSSEYSLIAVQGPKAYKLIEKAGLKKDDQPKFFSIKEAEIFGKKMLVSRTGYTGEDGFELLIKNAEASELWNELLAQGKEFGVQPIGLGARDTLRLEAALHLYGNDLTENTTPIEAGLKWSVSKNKEADYTAKNIIFEQLKNGVDKKLIGLRMLDKSIARHEYEVLNNGENVGTISSGCFSPTLGYCIALAYVKNLEDICIGSSLQVNIRGKLHDAEVVKLPFVEKHNKI